MPENQWTEAHNAFCLENKIPPAAKLLWQWLMNLGQEHETEPDLAEFNEWVTKHRGKGYCRQTLKDALAKLIELRIVQLVKQFTWRIVRIITRPLNWLHPKKNYQNSNKTFTSPTPNPQFSETGDNSSSNDHISDEQLLEYATILSECESAGITFNPEKSPEILDYTLEEVQAAIALFHTRSGIKNPQGWLLSCLRRRYYEPPQGWTIAGLFAFLGLNK